MVVLVTGSREFSDPVLMHASFAAHLPDDPSRPGRKVKPSLIVHGGARGADSLAGEFAARYGIACRVVRPRWTRSDGSTDRGAGFKRNCRMVDMKPDLVMAFFTAHLCSGTSHCVKYAKSKGVPVVSVGR